MNCVLPCKSTAAGFEDEVSVLEFAFGGDRHFLRRPGGEGDGEPGPLVDFCGGEDEAFRFPLEEG